MILEPRRAREFRAQLARFEAAEGEMVRVYVRGRRNLRAAVSYAGYPHVDRETVTLFGTDGLPRGTVRLADIAHIQRVFVKAPKTSRWTEPQEQRAPKHESEPRTTSAPEQKSEPQPARAPISASDAAAEVVAPATRTIRAQLELDISPALRQVEFLREKVQEALDRRLDDETT